MIWMQPVKLLIFLFFFTTVCLGLLNGTGLLARAKEEREEETSLPKGFSGNQTVRRWVAGELRFDSTTAYEKPFYDVDFDFVFWNRQSGTSLKIPAFWDGGQRFAVRFALTETGIWDFTVHCSDPENALHEQTGSVLCEAYSGPHEIYQRGFLKTNGRYFTYHDGTPFFYLGDTHWHMVLEDIDREITAEDGTKTNRFAYTLTKRAEQGFTVIQSEPLGEYDGENGYFKGIFQKEFGNSQLARFQQYDKYFALIAERGFVHANAQFSYPTELGDAMDRISDADLARLCRYWAARYAAYPVLWTLSQECDDDYYYGTTGQFIFTAENNPWKKVAVFLHEADPYRHPLSAHQENSENTLASTSAFSDVEGHNWWAAQINYDWSGGTQFRLYRDYWEHGSGKPGIEYEGRYDHFWTGTAGARLQGWLAFLNGMYGYGYGSAKIWSANEKPGIWGGAISDTMDDGLEVLTRQEMDITWQESLKLPAARQMGYMKQFFSAFEWWRLEPCFESNDVFCYTGDKIVGDAAKYSAAYIKDERYVVYFYNKGTETGFFRGLQKGKTYQCRWFQPCTGEYREAYRAKADKDGMLKIGEKPDNGDWVFTAVPAPARSCSGVCRALLACLAVISAAAAIGIPLRAHKKRRG